MQKGIDEHDFQRLYPKVVAEFRRQGLRDNEVLDLAQKTLLEAHRSMTSFEQRSELDTWVLSIAKNLALKHWRDCGRMKRSAAQEVAIESVSAAAMPRDKAPNPERTASDREQLALALQLIEKLPELMQQALMLYAQGRKYRTIATLLGVDENRVSSLIHQARTKIRRQFPT